MKATFHGLTCDHLLESHTVTLGSKDRVELIFSSHMMSIVDPFLGGDADEPANTSSSIWENVVARNPLASAESQVECLKTLSFPRCGPPCATYSMVRISDKLNLPLLLLECVEPSDDEGPSNEHAIDALDDAQYELQVHVELCCPKATGILSWSTHV